MPGMIKHMRNSNINTLSLKIIVEYDLKGAELWQLEKQMEKLVDDAVAEGKFTGNTEAEIKGFRAEVRRARVMITGAPIIGRN
jgi:hypothetical protein